MRGGGGGGGGGINGNGRSSARTYSNVGVPRKPPAALALDATKPQIPLKKMRGKHDLPILSSLSNCHASLPIFGLCRDFVLEREKKKKRKGRERGKKLIVRLSATRVPGIVVSQGNMGRVGDSKRDTVKRERERGGSSKGQSGTSCV